ncbi:MAG: hypothetical protein ACFE9Z_06460 [Promethearchaeota archaeon]
MNIIIEDKILIKDTTFYLNLFRMFKSFLLLISDQKDMGIGNVTLGSPPLIQGIKAPTASYNLFGVETKLLSTIIAERAANILKAPVLLLLFIKEKFIVDEIIKSLIKFLNKILEEALDKIE